MLARRILLLACLLGVAMTAEAAPPQTATPPSPDDVLKASPKSDWQALDPANTLVMKLAKGQVLISLAPDFAPNTIANIKKLAKAGYFDKATIVRSQDNYVVQWARDPEPPSGKGWAEFERARTPNFKPLKDRDTYAAQAGFDNGFAAASDGKSEWLVHCYGVVGVGRDNAPDSGSGIELYAVTGQAPRSLDRNITVVGRVVQGIDLLSSLPRGTDTLGFYKTKGERVAIESMKLAANLPAASRPRLEVLKTGSASFAAYAEARRNRGGPFFMRPANAIDVCNVPLPVRPIQ